LAISVGFTIKPYFIVLLKIKCYWRHYKMVKKGAEKNNKRMAKAVGKVRRDLNSLDFVDSCDLLNERGPSSRGSYKLPYVEYIEDLSSGIKAKVHVGCGYQTIRVSLKNENSGLSMVDNQRTIIRYLIYHYQLPHERPGYKPPPLEDIIRPP
jgi:hypothetical protein